MFIIRCRDTTGTKRFTLDSLDITVGQLLCIIIGSSSRNDKTSPTSTALDYQLSLSPSPTDPPLLVNEMLNKLSLQKGHLFYLHSTNSKVMEMNKNTEIPPSLQECYDAIREGKGTIKSSNRQQLGPNCLRSHGAKGMCPSCKPKEVWEIAKEMGVKHSSIHTYYQEQLVKVGKTFTLPATTTTTINTTGISCKHPPQNRCTNCTESKMTNLQRQPYRIVDHVEFLDPSLVDSFLRDGWRRDGLQHMAWIYGHYQLMDHKDDPPLGIKATAVFLHHPSNQKNFTDGFCVLDCCDGNGCDGNGCDTNGCSSSTTTTEDVLLEMFGLEKIGLLYTDLKQDHISGGGKVAQGRQTLSGSEFCFIANEQLKHKAPLPWSKEKTCFGSPFVTVVVSGDKEGQIGLEAYQCSTQCTYLVDRQLVKPCFELDMMSVNPSKGHEIVYGGSGGVGNVRADPLFPVDYFLVSLTTAFKDVGDRMVFIENDEMSSVNGASLAPQIRTDLKGFLCPLPQEQERRVALLKNMNLFIHLIPTLPKHDLHLLSLLIRKDDRSILCSQWWKDVVAEVEAAATTASTSTAASTSTFSTETPAGTPCVCSHCTFLNESGGDADGMCEMCGLPLH